VQVDTGWVGWLTLPQGQKRRFRAWIFTAVRSRHRFVYPWTRMRRVYALLGLVRRYGAARVSDVCTVALGADILDVHRLKRMLEQGAAAPAQVPPARVIPIARYLRPASQYKLPLQAASEGEESQ